MCAIARAATLVALLALALTESAHASLLTYNVSGTFTDGGSFSGTFGYDPVAGTFVDPAFSPYGEFDIASTGGSVLPGNSYISNSQVAPPIGYTDSQSNASQLILSGGGHFSFWNLVLDFAAPLNSSGTTPKIVGGSETFTANCQPGGACTATTRQVTPSLPLPASFWLMFAGLVTFAALGRRNGILGGLPSDTPHRAVPSLETCDTQTPYTPAQTARTP